MKVLGATRFGRKNLAFIPDRPRPVPGGPAEVLIRVRYADLNPVDLHKLRARPDGTPAPPHRSPLVVGFGGSGTVVAAGEDGEDGRDASAAAAAAKARDLVGKDVCFLADPGRDGSYAEYVVCDARLVCAVPPGVDMARAACVPVAGCTAFECLDKVGLPVGRGGSAGVEEGKRKRLLIVGGSGGVGSWTTQLARATYGGSIEIICTVGSPESAEWCTRMGADRTVPHDGIDERLEAGPGGSVDAVICLSEPTRRLFDSLAGVLRPFGRICLVVAGDAIRSLDLSFVFFKSGTVSTETVFSSIRCGYHLDQAGEMATILEAMSAGSLRAPLSDDWSEDVSGWEEANGEGGLIDKLDGGHTRGKYVMKITTTIYLSSRGVAISRDTYDQHFVEAVNLRHNLALALLRVNDMADPSDSQTRLNFQSAASSQTASRKRRREHRVRVGGKRIKTQTSDRSARPQEQTDKTLNRKRSAKSLTDRDPSMRSLREMYSGHGAKRKKKWKEKTPSKVAPAGQTFAD